MENPLNLTQQNLASISDRIPSPKFDRQKLTIGLVHIGVGGFHRAHQAYYTHQLIKEYNGTEWGICGVGLRQGDRKIHDVLQKQDGLYTLIVKHPDGTIKPEVIGSIVDFQLAVENM